MSKLKRLLALVLALTMVLSVSAFAGYTVAPYGDYAGIDEDCEVAVQLLYSLNIMKGDNKGNFNPEATITRAEVAKMIYVVLNYGEDDLAKNYTGAKFFSDVNAGDWYEGYVNYAASIKLVQGRPDGTFGPNDPVTCAEAAKMLLTAIGYSAEARGYVGAGWDKQVLSDASIIGLLDGYDYNTNTYAPRQWVAVMFKNALIDALTYETIYPAVFNSLLTGYTDYEYETMGEKYFDLYKWSGVITANEYANLDDDAKALSSERTEISYVDDDDKTQTITFKNWTTDLTEIGESRWGYACGNKVMYVGDTGNNTEFSTGEGVEIVKKNIGGIKLDKDTEYFMNFNTSNTVKEEYETGNGDWLRVVDNNDDGYADYVFVTEFEMAEVTKVAKNGTLTLSNKESYKDDVYATSAELAKGDIVLFTTIDGTTYVELAPSFTGEVDKYTYRGRILTVEGEDYAESDIKHYTNYYDTLDLAERKTEYTYYQDFFNHIRIFGEDVSDAGELVLLTDAYYGTGRDGKVYAVDAYLDGEINDYDVKASSSSDYKMFIEDAGNKDLNAWDRLAEFEEGAGTNIARYTKSDEGVLTLYSAQTHYYDKKGNEDGIKTDYVDLKEVDLEAGQATYKAEDDVVVHANRDTVYYYVSYPDGIAIETVVGYKNSVDVIDDIVGIKAMYAVASWVEADADEDNYWVADVIVIETADPAFNLSNDVVLGYDIVNKTVKDFASLDVVNAEAALANLSVISVDGYNKFGREEIPVPAFYFNTEDEEGESWIRPINKNFGKYGIFVGTVDKKVDLFDYVVAVGGEELTYDEETVVYDLSATKSGYHYDITDKDSDEDALTLTTGSEYIFYAPKGDIVFAILVEDSYDKDGNFKAYDAARELYEFIKADAEYVAPTALETLIQTAKDLTVNSAETYAEAVKLVADLEATDSVEAHKAAAALKASVVAYAQAVAAIELQKDYDELAGKYTVNAAAFDDAFDKAIASTAAWTYDDVKAGVPAVAADLTAVKDDAAVAADKAAADAAAAKALADAKAAALADLQTALETALGGVTVMATEPVALNNVEIAQIMAAYNKAVAAVNAAETIDAVEAAVETCLTEMQAVIDAAKKAADDAEAAAKEEAEKEAAAAAAAKALAEAKAAKIAEIEAAAGEYADDVVVKAAVKAALAAVEAAKDIDAVKAVGVTAIEEAAADAKAAADAEAEIEAEAAALAAAKAVAEVAAEQAYNETLALNAKYDLGLEAQINVAYLHARDDIDAAKDVAELETADVEALTKSIKDVVAAGVKAIDDARAEKKAELDKTAEKYADVKAVADALAAAKAEVDELTAVDKIEKYKNDALNEAITAAEAAAELAADQAIVDAIEFEVFEKTVSNKTTAKSLNGDIQDAVDAQLAETDVTGVIAKLTKAEVEEMINGFTVENYTTTLTVAVTVSLDEATAEKEIKVAITHGALKAEAEEAAELDAAKQALVDKYAGAVNQTVINVPVTTETTIAEVKTAIVNAIKVAVKTNSGNNFSGEVEFELPANFELPAHGRLTLEDYAIKFVRAGKTADAVIDIQIDVSAPVNP